MADAPRLADPLLDARKGCPERAHIAVERNRAIDRLAIPVDDHRHETRVRSEVPGVEDGNSRLRRELCVLGLHTLDQAAGAEVPGKAHEALGAEGPAELQSVRYRRPGQAREAGLH